MIDDRPLSEIVADVEAGVPLTRDEAVLVSRLAAQLPPKPAREFIEARDRLIREAVDFAPESASSVLARAAWLEERFERFVAGADWRRDRAAALCPHADPLKAALWRLAQFGPLPRDRKLREIIGGT